MELTAWDHTFPTSIIQPPDKSSVISIHTECLTDNVQLYSSRQAEQHICYEHQMKNGKILWKCHHCDKNFDSDKDIRDHLDFLKNSFKGKLSEKYPTFPAVHTVLPDKILLKLANSDAMHNSLLNANSDELFQFGLEASILKKRLLLDREPRFWEKDYVRFLKDTCHADISDTEDILEEIPKPNDIPMDTGTNYSAICSENVPITITTDDELIGVPREQWLAMATQLHLNTKMIEGVTDTIHFQCGLLKSIPSENLSMSEHHHLERLLHTRDLPPEFRQLHKGGTKDVGRRFDDLVLGNKKKY